MATVPMGSGADGGVAVDVIGRCVVEVRIRAWQCCNVVG